MHRGPVFRSFREAAANARRVAANARSDVLVSRVDSGWTLEIEALKRLEEAMLDVSGRGGYAQSDATLNECVGLEEDALMDVEEDELAVPMDEERAEDAFPV